MTRVALVHDWLTGMRGGERVLERLCALFPGAPIHTLLWNRGALSPAIESHPIHTTWIDRLPAAGRLYRWYLPLFPRAIQGVDLTGAEAVVSSSHCVAKAAPVPAGAYHLSYIHTPMRYVWELEEQYFPKGRFPWPFSWYVRRTCASLRHWDRATASAPHALVANSAHVAERIARHYGRPAQVIHPPVAVERFAAGTDRDDFYLLAGAFAPYKRGDLAIEACRVTGRRLKIAGGGQDQARLARLAGPGIEFLGRVDDAAMARLFATARALLFPGEEDFGIIPVEAMASGCPVIALGRGGAIETVGRGLPAPDLDRVRSGGVAAAPGGVLFGNQSVPALAEAMRTFEGLRFDPRALRDHAAPFATERFDREFRAAFERGYAEWRATGAAASSAR